MAPMPRVDELLDRLGRARFISTLDLTKGILASAIDRGGQAKNCVLNPQ